MRAPEPLNAGFPRLTAVDPGKITKAPSLSCGSAFWTVVGSRKLHRNLAERHHGAAIGVGEANIDLTGVLAHDLGESIEVGEIGNVTLHATRVAADLGHRRIEFGFAATGHEYPRAPTGRRLAPAGPTGRS
ncbi:MAG: hypothetical protein H7Z10_12810 [Gemmatimonadaceae bacterium]|nr:hypothetical protein [Acetobacteraceae bacterium]